MQKFVLDREQVQEFVTANKYKIDENAKFLSRCIDGRYPNSTIAPLAIPGGDGGEIALIAATGKAYGFEVDLEKAYKSLLRIVNGINNFNIHTDDHHQKEGVGAGCGHLAQMKLDPKAYNLDETQIGKLFEILDQAKKDGAKETVLDGPHLEGAVLIVSGNYGVKPQYDFQFGSQKTFAEVFVFHQTLVNERHKVWSKYLYEDHAVKLYDDANAEYLYEVLCEITDNHLFETAKRLAKGLNIFTISFEVDGSFKLEESGKVQ